MVVAADKAAQDEVKRAMNRLRMVGAPVVGTVLNNTSVATAGYGAGYGRPKTKVGGA